MTKQTSTVRFDVWPWNNQAALKDLGTKPHQTEIQVDGEGNARLYHVTSENNAAMIFLTSQPRVNSCKIGFDNREMPAGFYCNAIPFMPYAVEMWMPAIERGDIAILEVLVPQRLLPDRYVFDPTWRFPQFAIQPDDIEGLRLVHAEEFVSLRRRDINLIAKFLTESSDEGLLPENAHFARAVMARVNGGSV